MATCDVCKEPILSDESYHKDAHGTRHIRCSGGHLSPRPRDMERVCPKCKVQMSKCTCFYGALVGEEGGGQ